VAQLRDRTRQLGLDLGIDDLRAALQLATSGLTQLLVPGALGRRGLKLLALFELA
jgi:hypothetical protein